MEQQFDYKKNHLHAPVKDSVTGLDVPCCKENLKQGSSLEPLRCTCSPDTTIICFISDTEIELQCRHGEKIKIVVVGDGKLVKL